MDTRTQHDNRIIPRCKQLGMEINFKYCRTMNNGLPCRAVFDCWFVWFDIVSFIDEHYTPEEIAHIRSDKKSRIDIIRETIKRGKQ